VRPDTSRVDQAAARSRATELELKSFSYIVSHDLAASLRHVTEFSRLLLDGLSDDLTPLQQDHATHVRRAADNCQLMMEQLLVFSRIQQNPLQTMHQDASTMVEFSLLPVKTLPGAIGAEFDISPLGDVFADPDLLSLAFHHLLDNAIKFRRPGQPPRVTVRPAHDDTTFRIRVTDNGIGVPELYREKAFRMFQRLNAEDAYPGAGAGLAICRRIARLHGGDVAFVDCEHGACVEISLPRAPPPRHKPKALK